MKKRDFACMKWVNLEFELRKVTLYRKMEVVAVPKTAMSTKNSHLDRKDKMDCRGQGT